MCGHNALGIGNAQERKWGAECFQGPTTLHARCGVLGMSLNLPSRDAGKIKSGPPQFADVETKSLA